MHWRVKGLLQQGLSLVPGGVAVNSMLQRTIGQRRSVAAVVKAKIDLDWVVLMEHMRRLGIDPAGLTYLEIGSGWLPVLPICYALSGAARVHSFDLTRLMDRRRAGELMAAIAEHVPKIAAASNRRLEDVQADFTRISSTDGMDSLLAEARIDYQAPADARRTGLREGSVDVVFSNSVLEHIGRGAIVEIFEETARVLRPGGWAIHSANCGDHYAHFDRSITQLNYLSYPDWHWRLWNNSIQYQNRLRARDFLSICENAGLPVVLDLHKAKPAMLERLATMRVAEQFKCYPPEELACTSIDFVARKPSLS